MPPRRALLAAMLAAALIAPSGASADVEPGIVATLPFSARDAQNVRELGAKTVRFFLYTDTNPSVFDQAVGEVESAGARPLFVVVGDTRHPPTTAAAVRSYAAFIGSAAAHFKGRVAGWEVWNEPDGPRFWNGMPPFDADHPTRNAGDYATLLAAAHDAVKAADPSAPVVTGGLTGNDYPFLRSLYSHASRDDFDAVAVHTDTACAIGSPYDFLRDTAGGLINQFSFLGLLSIRSVMVANDDRSTPVWLTETGWSSYTGTCRVGAGAGKKAAGVGEPNQAAYLAQAMHCIRVLDMGFVTKALPFKLNEENEPDPMDTAYGFVRPNGDRKPVFDVWKAFAASGDQLPDSEPCGDFDGPEITIDRPASGGQFAGALPIDAAAKDPAGVGRISLFVDPPGSARATPDLTGYDASKQGTEIRNFTEFPGPPELDAQLDWQGAKRLSLGTHRINVVAVDAHGNVSRRIVEVRKVSPSSLPRIRTSVVATLRGTGARRSLSVRIKPAGAGLTSLLGKIDVRLQRLRKGRWLTAHRYSKSSKGADRRSLVFPLKLEKATWRIVVRYRARKNTSYTGTTRTLQQFSVR